MKKSIVSAALVLAAIIGATSCAGTKSSVAASEAENEMFFSTEYVVDWVYYGEPENGEKYYVVYDDPDANMEYAMIAVTAETYSMVVGAAELGVELVGTIAQTDSEEYEFHTVID